MMKEYASSYFGWWYLGVSGRLNEKEQFPGELVIDDDSANTLRILGESEELRSIMQTVDKSDQVLLIAGFAKSTLTNKDYIISLVESKITRHKVSGLIEFTFAPSFALFGYLIQDLNTFRIGQINFRPKFLENWIGVSGHKAPDVDFEGKFSIAHSYEIPDPILLSKDRNQAISVQFYASSTISSSNEARIKEWAYICVRFSARRTLAHTWRILDRLSNFFSFSIGEGIPVCEVELKLYNKTEQMRKGIKKNPVISVIRKTHQKYTSRQDIRAENMLLPLSIIQENCPNIIYNWLNRYKDLKPALNLYFGKIYNRTQYVENSFLDIVIALEVFHRLLYPNYQGKTTNYDKKIAQIMGKLNSNDRRWLQKRLKSKQEKTLLNRFEDMEVRVGVIIKALFKKPKMTFEKIVTTRNHLVHHSIPKVLQGKIIRLGGLPVYTDKLTVLFQSLLIDTLTNDAGLVNDRYNRPVMNKLIIRLREK